MRKAKIILLLAVAAWCNTASAQFITVDSAEATKATVHYFSLEQALDYAVKNSVQVKNAILAIGLQQEVNREVTGNAYPHLQGSSQTTYNAKFPKMLIPGEFVGQPKGTFIRSEFGSARWQSMAGFSATQLLFDGQVFTGLQARNTLIAFSKKQLELTNEQIKATVTKIYYQLVVSRTQIALMDSNIALVNKNIHDTKIMYDNGFAEGLEIDKLKVNLANLHSQKTKIINQIINGYLGLKVLMGMPVDEGLILTDSITDEDIKTGVLEALDFDYTKRKDFQLATLGSKLREYDMQRYKLSKLPTIALNGYWNQMTQSPKFDIFSSSAYWSPVSAVTLSVSVPIFTGFSTNAKIAQARIKWQQSQNEVIALKNNIDNEKLTAINNFKAALTDLDYQKENIRLAERVYAQTKKKYEVGTGTQIEIDAARVQLEASQTNYYNALYNAVIARVDFLKATGQL